MEIIPVYGIVYLITCLVNGKIYVGQTVQAMSSRFYGHLYSSRHKNKTRREFPIARAIQKYGIDNFNIVSLCSCVNQIELDLMEDLYIVAFDALNQNKGYNLKRGGAKGKASEQTKKKQSETRRGADNARYLHHVSDTDISRLYLEGNGTVMVGSLLGISATTVAKRLKKQGILLRRTGHPPLTDEEKLVVGTRMKIRHSGSNNPAYKSDIDTDEIVRLRREQLNAIQISEILKINPSIVRKRLKKTGIQFPSLPPNRNLQNNGNRRDDVPISDLVRMYEEGCSRISISKKHMLSESTVSKRLTQYFGQPLVWKSKKNSNSSNPNWNSNVPMEEVSRLYLEGYSTQQLCDKYSVHSKTIKHRLKQAGIILKTGPRPKKNGESTSTQGRTTRKTSKVCAIMDS